MPYPVPSAEELAGRFSACMEAHLGRNARPEEKSFASVIAAACGMAASTLYAYAAGLSGECLVLTASEKGLEALGKELGIYRGEPSAWEGTAEFDLPEGMALPLGTVFTGPQGLKYETTASAAGTSSGPALIRLACARSGPSGNLEAGAALELQTPAGAGRRAEITGTSEAGRPKESLEAFRRRVIDFQRSEGGGGNAADYRLWAQAAPGVERAYPFTGPPEGTARPPLPGERTVYIECSKEINADGIPPESLLTLAKEALLADPGTGVSREILGLPAETLHVMPVLRRGIFVTVAGMRVKAGSRGEAEAAARSALEAFFESFGPFVQGLDADFEKRDSVTAPAIAREIQNALDACGGSAQNVLFGTAPGVFLGRYDLRRNEKLKLAGLCFAGEGE